MDTRSLRTRWPSLITLLATAWVLGGCADDAPVDRPEVDAGPDAVEDVDPADADAPELTGPDTLEDVSPDLPPADVGPTPPPPWPVRAFVSDHPSHLVGGPKAEGRVGDIVMESDTMRFVIETIRDRPTGGYRQFGGNLVDMGLGGGRSEDDHFGELWFGWNLMIFEPREVEIVSDGEDGVAHVRFTGQTALYPWADSFIRPLLNPPVAPLHLSYDYRLRVGEPFVELTITALNDGPANVNLDYTFMLVNQGDGVKVWTYNGAGFGGLMAQRDVRLFGAVGFERSYGVVLDAPMSGLFAYANMELSNFPITTLRPTESQVLKMSFAPTEGGSGEIAGVHADFFGGDATGWLQGVVQGHDATTWVTVFDGSRPLGVVPVDAEGRFRMRAPPGIWTARAFNGDLRSSESVNIRSRVMDPPLATLTLPEVAELEVHVVDAEGNWIPAQVTITSTEVGAPPEAAQLLRTGRRGDSALFYATTPDFRIPLPPASYTVVISRGYSYDMRSYSLTLSSGESERLEVTLPRMVDTEGWIAGDFHLHGWWSSDAEVPYDVRVRQAAANDIGLPVLTEHAYIGDLEGAAVDEGLEDWVSAIPAQEVTTFEYGHFNAFPLVYDPLAPSGGAVFEHGRPGTELFDAMKAQHPGEVLIQVNHPRSAGLGFGYFQITGLNAATRTVRNPQRWTERWELIEVFNGRCEGYGPNESSRDDWFALTNAGLRPGLSSGSDSHTEAAGIGHPRQWVEVELAAVSLDPQAIVAPLKSRQSFVSCGPFVGFSTSDGVGIGGRATVDGDGEVAFVVSVQAPPWMSLTDARLYENGRVIRTVPVQPAGQLDAARPGLRLDTVMRASPTQDAWYALEVRGTGRLPFPFPNDTPYALTNGIEVDVDGDGRWTAPGN